MHSVNIEIKPFIEIQNDTIQHSFMSDLKDAVTEISEAELGVTCLLLVGSTASNLLYLLWSSLSPSPRCPLLLVMAVSDVSMSVTSLVLQLTQPQSLLPPGLLGEHHDSTRE